MTTNRQPAKRPDREEPPTLVAPGRGAHPPAVGAEQRVHSTATDELMQRLAEAPKLDVERYAFEGEVDRGGMGAILKIHDRQLNRRLAMKVMLEREAPQDDYDRQLARQFLGRFLEEAQVTSQLDHPGVVPVHELGLDQNGKVFFTMRLIKGRTAGEVFAQAHGGNNGWTLTRALEIVLKVCDTMSFAHAKGIVHRDLKPDNVMVGRFGEVYVMDWGLAKVLGQDDRHDLRIQEANAQGVSQIDSVRRRQTDSDDGSSVVSMDGQRLGTPHYMPPEQARSEPVDQRADVYAIGAMLYELLTGRPPYMTPGLREPAYRILQNLCEASPKPIAEINRSAPAELIAIVDKAMARERDDRYGDVGALADDLRAFVDQRAVQAYRTGALVELKLWVKRNKPLAASMLAAALALLLGIAGTTVYAQKADREAEQNARLASEKTLLAASEAQAKDRFMAKVDEFNLLAGVVRYERVVDEQRLLYPAWPAMIPAMERWLSERCGPLLAMRPAIDRTIADLRATALDWTVAEQARDLETHPSHAEWMLSGKRLASLQRAQAARKGTASSAPAALDEQQLGLDADFLQSLVSPRTAPPPDRTIWGEEALGLAAARRAVAICESAEKYRHIIWLAFALTANGLDDEAAQAVTAAIAVAPAEHQQACAGYARTVFQAIEGADAALAEAAAAHARLDAAVHTRRTWTFPDERASQRFLHDALVELLAKLDALAERDEPAVLLRRRWAGRIDALTRAHPNARTTWAEARARIAASDRYAGCSITLDPEQLLGLVPLGENPVTGYFEFYHLRSAWDSVSDPAEIVIPEHLPDGSIRVTGETGVVFVLLPGGTFTVGAQSTDPNGENFDPLGRANEIPHEVTLSPFLLARHEMTLAQWSRLCDIDELRRPSDHVDGDSNYVGGVITLAHPVECVDWFTCDTVLSRNGLQLPTDAQWEYGCRAGTTTPFYVDREALVQAANFADARAAQGAPQWGAFEDWDDGHVVHAPVGSFRPNAFGLHDMHGNLLEWCRDWRSSYGTQRAGDGLVPGFDDRWRGVRGGSFMSLALTGRSAKFQNLKPATRNMSLGLRAARRLTN